MTGEYSYLKPKEYVDLERLGVLSDGGYVVNKTAIMESQILVTFGLGPDFSFEQDFIKLNPNSKVYVYDHTINRPTVRFLASRTLHNLLYRNLARIKEDYSYFNKYRSFFNGQSIKHLRRKISDFQFSEIDIDTHEVLKNTNSEKIFLKIDIEGDEFKSIPCIYNYVEKIQGMVIEFHNLGYTEPLLRDIVSKLDEFFEISHVHPNNYSGISRNKVPDFIEVTFINKNLKNSHQISTGEYRKKLPISGLDFPNGTKFPQFDIVLD